MDDADLYIQKNNFLRIQIITNIAYHIEGLQIECQERDQNNYYGRIDQNRKSGIRLYQ